MLINNNNNDNNNNNNDDSNLDMAPFCSMGTRPTNWQNQLGENDSATMAEAEGATMAEAEGDAGAVAAAASRSSNTPSTSSG